MSHNTPNVGQYASSFFKAVKLLRTIEAEPLEVSVVKELNYFILGEIVKTEKLQTRFKTMRLAANKARKTGRHSKGVAASLLEKIERIDKCIEACRYRIFIWKSFGDGLAYLYISKFSMKHAFFDTRNYEPKLTAGMIHGKAGLKKELEILELAFEHGLPAVLCDITNTLRHGDICLLGTNDPYLLEVKSGRAHNQRTKRQSEAIAQIHLFLETDEALNFRGQPGKTRRAAPPDEVTHLDQLNSFIREAKRNGYCAAQPEAGLTYLAVYGGTPDFSKIWSLEQADKTIVFILNEAKNDFDWAPYMPFTLTIREAQHLFDFVIGNLILVVSVDVGHFGKMLEMPGWRVTFNAIAPTIFQFSHKESQTLLGISRILFARVGYEFVSLASASNTYKFLVESAHSGMGKDTNSDDLVDIDEMTQKYFHSDFKTFWEGKE
ncbi:hypothetical protein Plav_2224 [Parvibaculum lavamentivorans DS-1]|uniref:Uncharacterized protein n=1 Tax=Parvibaculum lavamentivorans (strain DS-1 / DSM 13023 / NCIMB 13966) TaxID=402881 RepID=A7HVA5_PARL1|nr:hypothetical protein [Parvibaculum lavamentivorans]ABS63838.1 hypothetical protein Plav_2224 [Parvibaculum lavamentivorans DS-1]